MPTSGERVRWVLAWLGAAILLGAMAAPMVQGQMYLGDDLGGLHAPMRAFYARCLAAGHAFAWCPDLFCGYDLQGEGQAGMAHPLHRLLYGSLPLCAAFNMEILSSYAFVFAGMYLLLRRRDLPRDASAFGALFFTFAGYNLFHFHHVVAVATAAHIPWLLLGIDGSLRAASPGGRAWSRLGLAVATASLLLIGFPQNVAFALVLEGLYTAHVVVVDRPGWDRLAGLVGAKLLGLLGGGAQILPTWDSLRLSVRQKPTYQFLSFGSLHPANLVQVLAPYLYRSRVFAPAIDHVAPPATGIEWRTGEFGLYNGALVPVLTLYVVLRWRELGRERRLATLALGLAALGLLLAFGRYTPLYRLYLKVPVLNLFRVNARYVLFYHLATATLAAIALADLARQAARNDPMPWRRAWPLAAPVLFAGLIALGAQSLGCLWPEPLLHPYQASSAVNAASVGLVAVAASLVIGAARGRRGALVGIILFATVDLGVYGLTYLSHFNPGRLEDFVAATGLPPGPLPGSRVKQLGGFPADTLALRGLQTTDGYLGLNPRQVLDPDNPTTWRVSAVEWLLDQPWGGRWTPLPDPLPRFRMVPRAVPSADPRADLNTLDHRSAALVESDLGLIGDGSPGGASLVAERPGRLRVETQAPTRQLLVVADRYHPGWNARVDGQVRPVLRVNGDFLGCVVDPGRHRVVLHFDPWSHRAGRALSIIGLVLMGATAVLTLRRRRKHNPALVDRPGLPPNHLGTTRDQHSGPRPTDAIAWGDSA